jgi:hypothetical protein
MPRLTLAGLDLYKDLQAWQVFDLLGLLFPHTKHKTCAIAPINENNLTRNKRY